MKQPHLHYTANGFTLIEVSISVAVLVIITVLASNFVVDGLNIQRYVSEQNDAVVESRKALETMSGELREMVAADTGAYPIESVSEQEIVFYSDVDNDNYTERIRYYLDGTNLKRSIIEPTGDPLQYLPENETTTIFSQYIQNGDDSIFTYYNENYPADTVNNPLTDPIDKTEIRLIHIYVLTNVDPNRIPETRELQTGIQLRNLKENFDL